MWCSICPTFNFRIKIIALGLNQIKVKQEEDAINNAQLHFCILILKSLGKNKIGWIVNLTFFYIAMYAILPHIVAVLESVMCPIMYCFMFCVGKRKNCAHVIWHKVRLKLFILYNKIRFHLLRQAIYVCYYKSYLLLYFEGKM